MKYNFIWKNTCQKNNIHSPNYKDNPSAKRLGSIHHITEKTDFFFNDLTDSWIVFTLEVI